MLRLPSRYPTQTQSEGECYTRKGKNAEKLALPFFGVGGPFQAVSSGVFDGLERPSYQKRQRFHRKTEEPKSSRSSGEISREQPIPDFPPRIALSWAIFLSSIFLSFSLIFPAKGRSKIQKNEIQKNDPTRYAPVGNGKLIS
jgi:hypothetical protein